MIASLAGILFTLVSASEPAGQGGAGQEGGANRHGRYVSSVSLPNVVEDEARATEEAYIPDENCRNVDLPPMVVPVVSGDRLRAYAFVTVRLCMSDRADHWNVRDEQHILLDRLVRAGHATPFERTGRGSYDPTATEAAFMGAAEALIGEGMAEEMDLLGGDMRALNN